MSRKSEGKLADIIKWFNVNSPDVLRGKDPHKQFEFTLKYMQAMVGWAKVVQMDLKELEERPSSVSDMIEAHSWTDTNDEALKRDELN